MSQTAVEPHRDWASAGLFLRLGAVALFLVWIALFASSTSPTTYVDPQGVERVHFGFLSLVPAAVAIVLAFATRQVIVALFLGIATGAVIFAFGSGVPVTQFSDFPWSRANMVSTFLIPQIGTPGFAVILVVYLWSLGGLIGLWGRTGGALHFAQWVGEKFVVGPRSAKFFAWLLGVIFHQGGTISTVLAGTTVRPLLDKHKVSKEEGAYLVDSTASPIAVLLPFNAFPFAAAAGVVATIPYFTDATGGGDFGKAVTFFFESIPYYFYPMFAVLFTLLLSVNVMPAVLGMRGARRRVEETGEIVRPGSEPLQSKELTDVTVEPGYRPGLADFFLPLGFLLVIAIGPYFIQQALGAAEPDVYVVEAFFMALLVGLVVALVKGMRLKDALNGVVDGAKGVTMAAIILALAVSIKGVADALGTGAYVADVLGDLEPALLPLLLMVGGMVVAFSTGTSFGTFAVLLPVAMVLANELRPDDLRYLSLSFGAVVSGSIFGDQASPISDTTVLSSLAVGCDLMDHVTTQIPYAVIAAGIAGVLYVVFGFAYV